MQQQLIHVVCLIQNEELSSKNMFMARICGGSFHHVMKLDLCCLGVTRSRVS